ncbi:Exonuclease, phage-type [Rhodopseudomonas palustris TIE-1]|uniref:lambda exonuclease family protein n=1 Tax=Rhodopseudomonas palustris TaxID=1076 RepID=UPI000164A667|nr:lambda exonuclease family protein [Rhodopseudomonas palustris]ACF01538.1 Exonuclease, phage-type [Rhodopseudomonas palustris TIE-1]
MAIEIFDVEQNSPEWLRARMGIPTASEFEAIITPGKTKAEQKTRRTYMLKLAGELLTNEPMGSANTKDMQRGHALEDEARDLYQFLTGAETRRVGFIRNGRAGCSPDSLIGEDGGLEIKTKAPHLLLDVIMKDEFPEEHKAQVQGALWLTNREWWDIAVYWRNLPLFIKRAYRDEPYIQRLATEVDRFNAELDAIVAEIRLRGEALAA